MNITQSHVNMCIEIYNFTKKNKKTMSAQRNLYTSVRQGWIVLLWYIQINLLDQVRVPLIPLKEGKVSSEANLPTVF